MRWTLKKTTAQIPCASTNSLCYMFAVCTPLMRRVHSKWPRSGELCFVDSSGTMDRHSYRVFLLLTYSPAGGLPIGALTIPSEDEATIKAALKMLFAILPENAWKEEGPKDQSHL